MHLLLHAPALSPRLQYICQFIFAEMMSAEFRITTELPAFEEYAGPKIQYGAAPTANDRVIIGNHGLLFEDDIREQDTRCFGPGQQKAFFKVEGADLPFDILAASFYLLARYEEYLPGPTDLYGRYPHELSLAFKEDFLKLPLINSWIGRLAHLLHNRFPAFAFRLPLFSFLPTYDIDIAFSYKHKGWLRNAGGFLKRPSLQRLSVLAGARQDPFDAYEWLHTLHKRHGLQPLYFFLLAQKNGKYDKNILPAKAAMQQLVRQHAAKYATGIHPSWQSGDHASLLISEKARLESITGIRVTRSRQHYIRFSLPQGYRILQECGITDDYSMGYGGINGFRASVASSFLWFDLLQNQVSRLRVHPFCFMDANSFYEQQCSAAEAIAELMYYLSVCKEVNGELVTIWHNNFLGTDAQFAGWQQVYTSFLQAVTEQAP